MAREKLVSNDDAIGATVISVEYWGPITVQTEDGRILEIRQEYGYDGVENNVYER